MLPYKADGAATTQAISLGVHCISDAFPEAMLLMEVLPSLLAARNFPRLASARMLELGYRDSPDPSAVAIVFVMVGMLSCEDVHTLGGNANDRVRTVPTATTRVCYCALFVTNVLCAAECAFVFSS